MSASFLRHLYDPVHPKKSPLLGRILSATVCGLGHGVVEMEQPEWSEPWLACQYCGARFVPLSALADDYEVVRV